MKTIEFSLNTKSIQNAIKEIEQYKQEIIQKTQLFAERLAQKGVEMAEYKILDYDAVYTGELLASIKLEKGQVYTNGAEYIVYTDCPWAQFVEFGTGIVGDENQHPYADVFNWKYDVNEHGEYGWWYWNDTEGEWRWTKGMPSRPFMYETAMQLQQLQFLVEVAREVFG